MNIFFFFQLLLLIFLIALFSIYVYLLKKIYRAEKQSGIKFPNVWSNIIAFNIGFMILSAMLILWINI